MNTDSGEIVLLSQEQLANAEIPEAFWTFSIESYAGSQTALKECHRYATNWSEARKQCLGLFIRGPEESKKTFLAVYVLKVLLLQQVKVRYISMPDLVDRILANELRVKDLAAFDCLAIDNVNAERNTFWPSALNRVLIARKDAGRPTIVVTQLSALTTKIDEFEAIYGKANLRLLTSLAHTIHAFVDPTKLKQAEVQRKQLFVEEAE